MPAISVIVPVYKVEKYIHRCINSVLIQTFSDFELILVDDGSPDNCGTICDEYAKKDSRVHVIHKENGGLSDARNAGIDWAFTNSNSEWLTFIDSDDWVHPEYLDFLFRAANDNGVGLSVTRYLRMNEYHSFGETDYSCLLYSSQELFIKERVNMIISCGKLFSKTDFDSVRFPVGKLHEDEFTTYKLLFKHCKIAFIDIPLYFYYVNSDSIINSKWSLSRLVCFEAFEQQMAFFKKNELYYAYASSGNALFTSCAKTIERIRVNYPNKRLLRIKYICKYYWLKISGYEKFITEEEKKKIGIAIHPRYHKLCKWIKKKKSNALELFFNK